MKGPWRWLVLFVLGGVMSACGAEERRDVASTEAKLVQSPGGTSYYVDSRRGDDRNPGTSPERAWKSLDRVNGRRFAPGDRVLFRAGTRYQGQLLLHGSGAKGKPILVAQYGPGARPRIDGEGQVDQTVLLRNGEYWHVRDLEVTNQSATPTPKISGVNVALEDFGTAHEIRLANLYVHDVTSSNVKEQGGSGVIFGSGGDRVKSRFDGLTIEKCHLVRTDRNGITGWSAYWARNSWYPSLHVVIRNNLLEDIGGDGIVPIGCDGAMVEHNVLRGGRMRAEDYAAGIWPWSCDNTLIQFNEVSGMRGTLDGQGFDSDWNSRNTIVQYNYSHDNEGGFILICNDGSQGLPHSVGNRNTVVRYNISQSDGERTFQISAVQDVRIYNNTIYVRPGLNVAGVWCHDWGGWAKGVTFENNVFYADGTMHYDFGQAQDIIFRNNVFYGHHEGLPAGEKTMTNDPKLVKPGGGGNGLGTLRGYQLQSESPCRGAGLPEANNGGRDFWGNKLPSGPPDIGAHQHP